MNPGGFDRLRSFLAEGLEGTRTVGRYELGEVRGEGGMGVVHAAWDPALERRVAIKLFRHADVERVRREAAAAARLDHPHIVKIHEIGPDFIVMDLVDGPPMAAVWSGFDEDRRLDLVETIARVVAHAHAAGVVHRDLKPGNILLRRGTEPVLTDFGLAHVLADDLSLSRAAAGTVPYMSPEQVQGKDATPASDIWALGVMAHEAVTTRRPFDGDSLYQIQDAIVRAQPAPINHPVAAVIARALSKDPAARFATATAFADALAHARTAPATGTGAPARFRLRARLLVGAAAILLCAGALAWKGGDGLRPGGYGAIPRIGLPGGLDAEARGRWFAEHERMLTRALAAKPDDVALLGARGRLRLERGSDARDHGRNPFPDWEAATFDLTRALALDPRNDVLVLDRGIVLAQRCAYKRMYALDPISDCEAAAVDLTRVAPQEPRAYTWRGNVRFNQALWLEGTGQDAGALFTQAEADLSLVHDPDTLARRGRVRAHLGRMAEAEADFREALAGGPDQPWLLTWWGTALRRNGDTVGAFQRLSQAIEAHGEHAEAWAERGWVRLEQGDGTGAIHDFEMAIRHNRAWEPLLVDALAKARAGAAP